MTIIKYLHFIIAHYTTFIRRLKTWLEFFYRKYNAYENKNPRCIHN